MDTFYGAKAEHGRVFMVTVRVSRQTPKTIMVKDLSVEQVFGSGQGRVLYFSGLSPGHRTYIDRREDGSLSHYGGTLWPTKSDALRNLYRRCAADLGHYTEIVNEALAYLVLLADYSGDNDNEKG